MIIINLKIIPVNIWNLLQYMSDNFLFIEQKKGFFTQKNKDLILRQIPIII